MTETKEYTLKADPTENMNRQAKVVIETDHLVDMMMITAAASVGIESQNVNKDVQSHRKDMRTGKKHLVPGIQKMTGRQRQELDITV